MRLTGSSPRSRRYGRVVHLLLLTLAAGLAASCLGARAELRRRGIAIDADQLVARATSGDAEVVELLLAAGVGADERDGYGNTPLLAACDSGSVEVVGMLLAEGADPNLGPAGPGTPPLALAAMRGHREIAGLLVEAGAGLERPDGSQGMTPLMMAARHGHDGLVEDLLGRGAEVGALDHVGWSALHHAARGGHHGPADRLLAAGADPRLEDADGWTPLDLAKSAGQWAVVDALETRLEQQARRRRTSRLAGSPLAIPPGWSVFDQADASASFWPEHATFATGQDPPGSRRILLRSPRGEGAQIFLILGRLGPWWDYYRQIVRQIESDPALEDREIRHLTSEDGVRLELRRYRLGSNGRAGAGSERIMAFGEARGTWVVVVDAGGAPDAPGIGRIEAVLRESRLLEVLAADRPS